MASAHKKMFRDNSQGYVLYADTLISMHHEFLGKISTRDMLHEVQLELHWACCGRKLCRYVTSHKDTRERFRSRLLRERRGLKSSPGNSCSRLAKICDLLMHRSRDVLIFLKNIFLVFVMFSCILHQLKL